MTCGTALSLLMLTNRILCGVIHANTVNTGQSRKINLVPGAIRHNFAVQRTQYDNPTSLTAIQSLEFL